MSTNPSEPDLLPQEADRVLIVVNPKAGRSSAADRVARLIELLSDCGMGVDRFTDLDEACARANEVHLDGRLRALVGVGGDGTATELVNRTSEGLPVTLLAAGTANLLSKHFGLTGNPMQLAQVIAAGQLQRMDVGRAYAQAARETGADSAEATSGSPVDIPRRPPNSSGAAGRLFLVMAGCGFDADVVWRVHASRHGEAGRGGHIDYTSYLKPIWKSIRSYEYPEIRVYCDEQCDATAEAGPPLVVARWAFAFNLPRYGWGLPLAPAACGTDGRLDLCTLKRGSLWHGLRYLAAVQAGAWHLRFSDCLVRRVKRLRLTSDGQVPYQLDGDPAGFLPVDLEVLPGRSTWVVPAAVAR